LKKKPASQEIFSKGNDFQTGFSLIDNIYFDFFRRFIDIRFYIKDKNFRAKKKIFSPFFLCVRKNKGRIVVK
jgi:hypothetical protein